MKNNLIISYQAAEAFDRSIMLLDNTMDELRTIANNMTPSALGANTLLEALKNLCDSINSAGAVRLHYLFYDIDEHALNTAQAAMIYRTVEELISNIQQHSFAGSAAVEVAKEDNHLVISSKDDGIGFDKTILSDRPGTGYMYIESRVSDLRGMLNVDTAPGRGTSVSISLPVAI